MKVVGDLLSRPKREYPHFAAGLMFMHHMDRSEVASHLRERSTALGAHIEKLTRIMGELRTAGVTRLSLIELAHKIAMLGAERSWVLELAREISDGTLEWKAGIEQSPERLRRRHGAITH